MHKRRYLGLHRLSPQKFYDNRLQSASESSGFETELYGILFTRLQTFTAGGAIGRRLGVFIHQLTDRWTGAGFDTFQALSASGVVNPDSSRGDFLAEPSQCANGTDRVTEWAI